MLDSFSEIKYQANLVRQIDLVSVLRITGAVQDKFDKHKWHTSQGIISVTATKFMNWTQGIGGGGAIDLIIHLRNFDFKTAVLWLADRFPSSDRQRLVEVNPIPKHIFQPPKRDNTRLPQVVNYLCHSRSIPLSPMQSLIHSGRLYADIRGNAVFLLLGKEKTVVGAELRGVTQLRWRGMAPGSRKDLGCFWVKKSTTRNLILCESAIDALSFFALHPDWLAISTSGATPNPLWLKSFVKSGYQVYCGFDADETGDKMAHKMILLHPTVKRLRPCKHDWNDALVANSKR
ncbi:MAG: DUF3991 domain-containing protein [bacterium]